MPCEDLLQQCAIANFAAFGSLLGVVALWIKTNAAHKRIDNLKQSEEEK